MKYIDDYESCSRTYATLLIYPKGRHPYSITERLGITPTHISVEGSGFHVTKVNGWFLSTQEIVESRDCRRHIDWLLDQIAPVSQKISELQSNGAKIRISCFWGSVSGNGGPTISTTNEKVGGIKHRGWDIWFEGSE